MARKEGLCKRCNQQKVLVAKDFCGNCYKRVGSPIITCKVCEKEKPHHALGLCSNCYLKTQKYDQVKKYNRRIYHNISLELWKELTLKCAVCGFDKIVDLHHLDKNKQNNSKENFIGLCPNHHRMIHDMRFSDEIRNQINEQLNCSKFAQSE